MSLIKLEDVQKILDMYLLNTGGEFTELVIDLIREIHTLTRYNPEEVLREMIEEVSWHISHDYDGMSPDQNLKIATLEQAIRRITLNK